MSPSGTKFLLHEKPVQRKSWNPHGSEGWYLGPTLEHNHCYRVYTNKTRAERIVDKVEFFFKKTTVPYQSPTDVVVQSIETIQQVCKNLTPSTPFAHVDHNQLDTIKQLAELFRHPKNDAIGTSPRVLTTATPPLANPAASPRLMPTSTALSHRYPTQKLHYAQKLGASSDVAIIHHFANAIIDPITGASMEYRHLIKSLTQKEIWTRSFANKLRRLAQGVAQCKKETDAIFF